MSDWLEDLPPQCPPADSAAPEQMKVYRAVRTLPPTEIDFRSLKIVYPTRKFRDECTARALSCHTLLSKTRQVLAMPNKEEKFVVELVLPPESGQVLQTGHEATHHSWWVRRGFDPIPIAVEAQHE